MLAILSLSIPLCVRDGGFYFFLIIISQYSNRGFVYTKATESYIPPEPLISMTSRLKVNSEQILAVYYIDSFLQNEYKRALRFYKVSIIRTSGSRGGCLSDSVTNP